MEFFQQDSDAVGIASFGAKLLANLCNEDPEAAVVLISPISLVAVIAIAAEGATKQSECESQLKAIIRLKNPRSAAALLSGISSNAKVDIVATSSVWCVRNFRQEYKLAAALHHRAKVLALPKTYAPMNEWVASATNGKIVSVGDGEVNPSVQALLMNAIYFKGDWFRPFDQEDNEKGYFLSLVNAKPVPQNGVTYMRLQSGTYAHASVET